jgi:hypothetical protein
MDREPLTVEESLRQIEDWAAMLRYMADSVALNPALPDESVMNGVGDVCGQIQQTAQRLRGSLKPDALCADVSRKRSAARRDT